VASQKKIWITRSVLVLLFTVGAVALTRDTFENGHDFTVFWKGARAVLKGEGLYSLNRDGGMVFKYPPWILPFFFPFGLVPLGFAKLCWGLVEVFSLAAVVQWIRIHMRCQEIIWVGVLISYWGLWAVHALDGQVSLVILAIVLWAWVPHVFERSWGRSFVIIVSLSTKIFTLFPLLQNRLSKKLVWRVIGVLGVLLLFSVPALVAQPTGSLGLLLRDWMDAATSGGALLSVEQIRGRYNPSLTSLILRLLNVPVNQPLADVGMACVLAILLGCGWRLGSRRLNPSEAWLGWLALAPVIHPLPWWHLFVFSFPLAVVSLDRAYQGYRQSGDLRVLGVAFFGVALICISTEKVLGSLGLFLEMACAKSWGVLICAGILAYISPKLIQKREHMAG
jgi:alpha-1,2-mannosyltransferase